MKFAIWGLYGSFDYHRIGGTDSIVRRLGFELIQRGSQVDFVHFGAPEYRIDTTSEGVRLCYYPTFRAGLDALSGNYEHILTFYVPPKLRLAYAHFRRREARRSHLHLLYTGWPEFWPKRELLFLEARLAPYNGCLFCVSPRQYRYVSRWNPRTRPLLPPVPENYFLNISNKPKHHRLRVAYIGRVDPGKGTPEAIAWFKHLAKTGRFETCIYGYPWRHKPETMQLHKQLLVQDTIRYEPAKFEGYSSAVDKKVRQILRETDVLFLPYAKLSSTIDTPLLLLEGMAHLCAVVTRPLGSLAEVYGTDRWMLNDLTDHRRLTALLLDLGNNLVEERARLAKRNKELEYNASAIADQFCAALQEA